MAESQEQRPPKTGLSTGGYLPRLWKAEPEPAPESDVARKSKKKAKKEAAEAWAKARKKGKAGDGAEDGPKGVLLEETPELDTIESRRKVRMIAGGVAVLAMFLGGFILFRVFLGGSVEDEAPPEPKLEVIDLRQQRERNETEARAMVERAREVAKHGNNPLAISLLTRASTAYPGTRAAAEAREAIGHSDRDLPAFADGPGGKAEAGANQKPKPNPKPADTSPPPDPTAARGPGQGAPTPPPSGDRDLPGAVPANPPPGAALAAIPAGPGPAPSAPAPAPTATPAPTPPAPETPKKPLPAGFQARSGVGVDPSGWPLEIVGGRDGSTMVLVPGGPFVMGRDGGDPDESPAHQVKLSTFYIDKHEVTNRQFDLFLKERGPRADRASSLSRKGGSTVGSSEDFPVVMVSARDAWDYAEWAGKHVPTEAQWEKAARGTDHRPYPWGPLPPVWEKTREPRQIDAVMSFPSDLSPYGAYDMAGNALEWTGDWYDPRYFAGFRGVQADNPTGPSQRPPTLQRTVKGGSKQWIVTAREGIKFEARLPFLGFRCALPVEGVDHLNPAPGAPGAPGTPVSPSPTVVPF